MYIFFNSLVTMASSLFWPDLAQKFQTQSPKTYYELSILGWTYW